MARRAARRRARSVRRPMAARPLRRRWRRSDRPPIEWWTGAVDVVHGPNFVVPPARRAAEVVTRARPHLRPVPRAVHPPTRSQYPGLIAPGDRTGAPGSTPCRSSSPTRCVDAFGVDPDRVVADPQRRRPRRSSADDRRRRRVEAVGRGRPLRARPRHRRAPQGPPARSCGPSTARRDDPDLRLVLAGPDGWGADALDRGDRRRPPRRPDRPPRLGDRRRRAPPSSPGPTVFAYPSRLRGVRAPARSRRMAAGIPVVATAAGALPEVLGDAAVLVPPRRRRRAGRRPAHGAGRPGARADIVAAGAARPRGSRGTAPPTGSSTSTGAWPTASRPDRRGCSTLARSAPGSAGGPPRGLMSRDEGPGHRRRRVRRSPPVAHLEASATTSSASTAPTAPTCSTPTASPRPSPTCEPDVVYHLGRLERRRRLVATTRSRRFRVNAEGTLNVLQAVLAADGRAGCWRSAAPTSTAGSPRASCPLTEDAPLRPVSPYAASKIAADYLGLQAWLGYGLDVAAGPGVQPPRPRPDQPLRRPRPRRAHRRATSATAATSCPSAT